MNLKRKPFTNVACVSQIGLFLACIFLPSLSFGAAIGPLDTSGSGIFAMGGPVTVYFVTQSASFSDDLLLSSPAGAYPGVIFNNHAASPGASVNIGNFAAGTELIFSLSVHNTGDTFFTGAGSRNADNGVHAATQTWVADSLVPANGMYIEFEDLLGGPFIFNDLDFVFTNVTTTPPPPPGSVPEPAGTVPLFLAAFGAWIALRRRAGAISAVHSILK